MKKFVFIFKAFCTFLLCVYLPRIAQIFTDLLLKTGTENFLNHYACSSPFALPVRFRSCGVRGLGGGRENKLLFVKKEDAPCT